MPAPTIQGNPTPALPGATGWILSRQHTAYNAGAETTTKTFRGPYSTLATAYAGCKALTPAPLTITPSTAEGSAIASLTCTFVSTTQSWQGGIEHEVRPPVYEIIPVRLDIRLGAFPGWADQYSQKEMVDQAIQKGTAADLDAGDVGANANAYRLLRLEGVEAFERTIFSLRVTRFFDDQAHYPSLAADYAGINKVFSWASIKTLGTLVIPSAITEPKWRHTAAADGTAWATSALVWRLAEVGPQYQGKYAVVVWVWDGAQEWESLLYEV